MVRRARFLRTAICLSRRRQCTARLVLSVGLADRITRSLSRAVCVFRSGAASLRFCSRRVAPAGVRRFVVELWGRTVLAGSGGIAVKTLGGRQFWGDVSFFRGWRVQQNIVTGHFRLLDARDCRRAWGSRRECENHLGVVRQQNASMTGHAVVLLHGLFRSSKSMARIGRRLQADGLFVVPFDYPSTRAGLGACAAFLEQVVRSLEGVERISFVGHSMGGLVVRRWMADFGDERVCRLVMLGTPNRGAEIAERLRRFMVARMVAGHALCDLVPGPGSEIQKLPIPSVPFAVIAGARGCSSGFNPLVSGDDDGVVAVESAQLEGAEVSLQVPVLHSFLPFDGRVIEAVSGCIAGWFRDENSALPLSLHGVALTVSHENRADELQGGPCFGR